MTESKIIYEIRVVRRSSQLWYWRAPSASGSQPVGVAKQWEVAGADQEREVIRFLPLSMGGRMPPCFYIYGFLCMYMFHGHKWGVPLMLCKANEYSYSIVNACLKTKDAISEKKSNKGNELRKVSICLVRPSFLPSFLSIIFPDWVSLCSPG